MIKEELGKITRVRFGLGGYQDAQIGHSLEFSFGGCATFTFEGNWSPELIECTSYCKWTEKDRSAGFDKLVRHISQLLNQAKVNDVALLKGKPVKLEFEGNTLKSWRLLTEVL
jgi:hypothetical protein